MRKYKCEVSTDVLGIKKEDQQHVTFAVDHLEDGKKLCEQIMKIMLLDLQPSAEFYKNTFKWYDGYEDNDTERKNVLQSGCDIVWNGTRIFGTVSDQAYYEALRKTAPF